MSVGKRRYSQIDVLYTIGTLLVIFGHSHSSDWSKISGTFYETALGFIYTFHMPLFFFIAGFLFLNSASIEKNGYRKWICDKALKLLVPYAVLSIAAAVPKYYFEHRSFSGIRSYIIEATFAPRLGVWGHFWFLPVLFILYLVFGLWNMLITEKNRGIALGITFVISIALHFLPITSKWLAVSDLKEAVPFFTSGMMWLLIVRKAENSGKHIKWYIHIMWIMLAAAVALSLYYFAHGNKTAKPVTGIAMIFVCWQISCLVKENSFTKWISSHNYTLYIYSWPFQAAVMVLCDRLNFHWGLTLIVMFVTGVCVPAIIILIYNKMKPLHNRFFDLLLGVK